VDRRGQPLAPAPVRVPLWRLREPLPAPPLLSLVLARWGGKHRLGEDDDPLDEGDGGWGQFGAPPTDWYMAAVLEQGVLRHPRLGAPGATAEGPRDCEVLSLFIGSSGHMDALRSDLAPKIAAALRGSHKASFWHLWPADWEADFEGPDYIGYAERRSLFASMRQMEDAGVRTSFPHPASLYELITSKRWMATLSSEPRSRLPAATLASRADIKCDARAAANKALTELEVLREQSVFAPGGGPAAVNRSRLTKGVAKIGWSWEAKFVWFWKTRQQLSENLKAVMAVPGTLDDFVIVQEWVDFDFELRLFFLPPSDWAPPAVLHPKHYEYTSWTTTDRSTSPGSFGKMSRREALVHWQEDSAALDAAHAEAEEAAQFLIGWLLETHHEPVPMIRMDFMLKRLGPGKAQVAFGEFCEMGACCLKWEDGPPMIWRAALDYALK